MKKVNFAAIIHEIRIFTASVSGMSLFQNNKYETDCLVMYLETTLLLHIVMFP